MALERSAFPTVVLSVRVRKDVAFLIRGHAEAADLSVSAWIAGQMPRCCAGRIGCGSNARRPRRPSPPQPPRSLPSVNDHEGVEGDSGVSGGVVGGLGGQLAG